MIKSEKEYRNLISRAWQYTQLSYPYSSESINQANYIKGLVNDLSDLLEKTKRLSHDPTAKAGGLMDSFHSSL